MRAWCAIGLLLLAGCAEPPPDPLEGVDPTQPLYEGQGRHLLGEPADGQPDAAVLAADCRRGGVFAYTFNATEADGSVPSAVSLHNPLPATNVTTFFIAAFTEGPEGLELAGLSKGGQDAAVMGPRSSVAGPWEETFPETLQIPLDAGIGRVAIGCRGGDPVNYVVGGETDPKRPQYLEPARASDFDVFAAVGSNSGLFITIPPSTLPAPSTVWYEVGAISGTHRETSPVMGVRVGTTEIRWSSGPGWTTATCEHIGWEEHGTWSYEGTLHSEKREAGSLMVDSIATLGLSQTLLFGPVLVTHAAEGAGTGEFVFTVEHTASADLLLIYTTYCQGLHIGSELEDLFGTSGAAVWRPPEGFV